MQDPDFLPEGTSKPTRIGTRLIKSGYVEAWFKWLGWCIITALLTTSAILLDGVLALFAAVAAFVSIIFIFLVALSGYQTIVDLEQTSRLRKVVVFIFALFGGVAPFLIGGVIAVIIMQAIQKLQDLG